MRCGRVISSLNTYIDGELSARQRRIVEVHLASCKICRQRLAEIRSLEILLHGTLSVPPVPDGLTGRIMAEARKRRSARGLKTRFPAPGWNPLQWVSGLSASMRIAACATVLLAFVAGLSLDSGQTARQNMSGASENNLYGLEWFAPIPTGSIGSAYIAMADEDYGKGRRQ